MTDKTPSFDSYGLPLLAKERLCLTVFGLAFACSTIIPTNGANRFRLAYASLLYFEKELGKPLFKRASLIGALKGWDESQLCRVRAIFDYCLEWDDRKDKVSEGLLRATPEKRIVIETFLRLHLEPLHKQIRSNRSNWFEIANGRRVVEWLETQPPSVWHQVSEGFNWGFQPEIVLMWIVKQDQCDVATALTIFLSSNFEDMAQLSREAVAGQHFEANWLMLNLIWKRLQQGSFKNLGLKLNHHFHRFICDQLGNPLSLHFNNQYWSPNKSLLSQILEKTVAIEMPHQVFNRITNQFHNIE